MSAPLNMNEIIEIDPGIEAITLDESKRLIALESKIKAGLQTFVEVGEALAEIREAKLYRIEHGTFEDYCREKWGMGIRFAQMQISGSKVAASLSDANNCSPIPTTESQVRPLTKLPAEQQPEAWARAVEIAGGGQPTAKQVQVAVLEIDPPEAELVPDRKQKITPVINQGNQIWANARMTLDTIIKQDASRVEALNKAIAYCKNRIEKNL